MEEAKQTLLKLKDILEEGKYQKDDYKISLYELKNYIKQYREFINKEEKNILKSISRKFARNVNMYISDNKVILLLDTINSIEFEINDGDVKVIKNNYGDSEPLKLIGREILYYYEIKSALNSINGIVNTDKATFTFYNGNIIYVTIKDTNLNFQVICLWKHLKFDYNSLKVIEFIKENEEDILKSILLEKKDIPTLDIITNQLKKIKKKSLNKKYGK